MVRTDSTHEYMNSTDISVRENVMRSTFYILTVVFVSLAVIGGVRRYSAVPFWDMWGAYVPFLDQANDSGWPAWWGQRRVVLANNARGHGAAGALVRCADAGHVCGYLPVLLESG
jgi:hypothetical protein